MRARYSAYVRRETPFLLASWHPTTRPPDAVLKESDVLSMMWLGLTVKHHETTGNKAIVEFIARFRQGGASAQRLHERSRFVREHGRWYYVDGDFVPD